MTPTGPTRPKEEIARLGDEIYERDIRRQVEADHDGELLAIDVDSGNWAVGDEFLDEVGPAAGRASRGDQRLPAPGWLPGGRQPRRRRPAESRVIEGSVNAAHEAVVGLVVRGPSGRTRDVRAVVDTGFSRFLTLPPSIVTELGLAFRTVDIGSYLADGSEATLHVYAATVLWDGRPTGCRCLGGGYPAADGHGDA